jgi:benzodiazapine receptor
MHSGKKRLHPLSLFVNLLIPFMFAAAGGIITMNAVNTWYTDIEKPSFNPPNWIFGPVWSLLFLTIGISAYLVWIKRKQIAHLPRISAIYFIQLILNLGWSYLFFYRHLIGAALFEIIALLLAIVINAIAFYKIDKTAGLLLIPYFLWVCFAAVLTYRIFMLN